MLSSYSDSQEDVFTDLLNFVFSAEDCKLVFIGDAGQLPPVGQEFSPSITGKIFTAIVSDNGNHRVQVRRDTPDR